jgi:hypothetical protein
MEFGSLSIKDAVHGQADDATKIADKVHVEGLRKRKSIREP